MNRKFFLIVILSLVLIGCEKKAKVETMPADIQQTFNQMTTPTQSELTLMQESAAKTPTQQVQPTEEAAVTTPAGQIQESAAKTPTTQEIQQALKNAHLYEGKIDGDFGPKTKKAIKEFQSQNDLKADGKVGPKTWTKLQPYLNSSAEPTLNEPKD